MLIFACVQAGNYQGRGKHYVETLHDMVQRNLPDGLQGKFVCFTDDPEDYAPGIEKRALPGDVSGWWNKLYLFKSGLFAPQDRIIFLDLDTVITGALDDLIDYDGEFAILRDFYRPDGFQSAVMCWSGSFGYDLWEIWNSMGRPDLPGGDQALIELVLKGKPVGILQEIFPKMFASYKSHCALGIPKDCKIVQFHGSPKPHEAEDEWVEKMWRIGGGSTFDMKVVANVDENILVKNIRYAMTLDAEWLYPEKAHSLKAIIVGGAPSAKMLLPEIIRLRDEGGIIFALNNAANWLKQNGISPHIHVMLDARAENLGFVPDFPVVAYYASQCHHDVLAAAGEGLRLWHSLADGMLEITGNQQAAYIGCGTSVGMKAMGLAYVLGYRDLHLYGMDSSYADGAHHAYAQPLNDGEKVIQVEMDGKRYTAAPWMVCQVNEFQETAAGLIKDGCQITVHGTGLLPDMAARMARGGDEPFKKDGWFWPSGDRHCHRVVPDSVGEMRELLGFVSNFDTVVQAGGNVGIWPIEMAKSFRRVITFEPCPLNFDCLERNIAARGIGNIDRYKAAVGDRVEMTGIAREAGNCGANYLQGEGDTPIVRIDDLGLENVGLIQLDVEGFEYAALCGAVETIKRCHPVIVTEEKGLGSRYGVSDETILQYLAGLGYNQYRKIFRDVVYVHGGTHQETI